MNFRDNLIHLRAAHNMTQEQLAMLLGVSRQSVTKWESGRSYPEMDKLLTMCQVFDCTLDVLVQGDLTDREAPPASSQAPKAPPADVFGYDEHMRRFASRISGGVMAIILGVAASLPLFSLSEPTAEGIPVLGENLSGALGMMCVLAGVAIGLAFLVPAGMQHAAFVRAHPYIEDFYTTEQKAAARNLFSIELVGGIVGIFAGVCVVMVFGDTSYESIIGIPVMMACIAVGVRFIIHGCMALSRTNLSEYNRAAAEELTPREIAAAPLTDEQKSELLESHKESKRIGAACGIIMLVATTIALLLLFGAMAAGLDDYSRGPLAFFWLPWPIGGLCCGVATLAIKGFGQDEA